MCRYFSGLDVKQLVTTANRMVEKKALTVVDLVTSYAQPHNNAAMPSREVRATKISSTLSVKVCGCTLPGTLAHTCQPTT